ncbi:synaptobrevin-like isoform X1 [Ostrea edulis]|uniref:synaptobrevin-like isoform X1 n=2 Tax=Ostrea edulis TaxID=37623 RepID=UPI0024AF4E84|nr:synaptobrevin-like isoform X1 [Ostrea edulis]
MSAPPQNPVAGPGGPPMSTAGGPGGPQPAQPSKRLQQTQAQVDEVVDIMRVNVDKVLERDQKISELDDRADALQAGASQFEASAGKLKRKYWWKNCKMMIILGVIIAVIVIIIIGKFKKRLFVSVLYVESLVLLVYVVISKV